MLFLRSLVRRPLTHKNAYRLRTPLSQQKFNIIALTSLESCTNPPNMNNSNNPKICYLDGFDDGVKYAWFCIAEWVVPLAIAAFMIAHIEYKRAFQ